MNHDDELLHRCADGVASPDELTALAARLPDDAELRARYLDLMNLDTALTAAADAATDVEFAPAAASRRVWLRPFTAAAAGLMVGVLTAGAVWAYAAPRQTRVQELPLADAGFDEVSRIGSSGVPDRPGRWAADPHEIVERHGSVRAREGTHMLRFLAASSAGDHAGGKWSGSDVYQVVELPGDGTRTVKIRAWFNAETATQARFHLAAVAGDGSGTSARELWAQRDTESASLAFARSTTFVDRDPATWEAGNLTLQVPPQARVLVIGITSYRMPEGPAQKWFPAQFVDDVSVSISEELQR